MKITYTVATPIFGPDAFACELEQSVGELRRKGFGVEIWDVWGPYGNLFDRVHWDRWRLLVQDMPTSLHGSAGIWGPGAKDFDPLQSTRREVDFAKYIGARVLVVHPAHLSTLTEDGHIADHGLAAELIAYADEQGVLMTLENTSQPVIDDALDRHPTLRTCLDTGHAAKMTEWTFEQVVDLLKPRLAQLHVHDNRGFQDDHQPPGMQHGIGERRWRYLLDAMREIDFDGMVCLEMGSPSVPMMMEQSLDFLVEQCGFNPPKSRTRPYAVSVREPEWQRPAPPSPPKLQIDYVAGCTTYYRAPRVRQIEEAMAELRELGLGYEIWDNWCGHTGYLEQHQWDRWAAACDGMLTTFHCWGGEGDCWKVLQREFDFCAHVGARHYVLHAGMLGPTTEQGLIDDHDLLARAIDYTGERSIRIALENGALDMLLDAMERHSSLGICLDVGHAHLDKEHTFREMVDALKHRLIHLHLQDNRGTADDHQPPGLRGGLPAEEWRYLHRALVEAGFSGIGVLETMAPRADFQIELALDHLTAVCGWPGHERH